MHRSPFSRGIGGAARSASLLPARPYGRMRRADVQGIADFLGFPSTIAASLTDFTLDG
ncbi:MAG: hypothetical protein AAFU85_31155 [Planctomycetota bacterium]